MKRGERVKHLFQSQKGSYNLTIIGPAMSVGEKLEASKMKSYNKNANNLHVNVLRLKRRLSS